jgi:hypothetical protein
MMVVRWFLTTSSFWIDSFVYLVFQLTISNHDQNITATEA